MNQSIQLKLESILQVPLNKYENDFTFIVNGEKYLTNKFIADLLSSKIAKIHSIDPTFNEFSFSTRVNGDFKSFLSIDNFEIVNLSDNEIVFFVEIVEALGTEKIDLKIQSNEITIDNITERLQKHEHSLNYFSQEYEAEIEFLAQHFHEVSKSHDELYTLSVNTFEAVFNNPKFQIETEDELLHFINKLYSKSSIYSVLYEHVCFSNVTADSIENFISIFNINDINQGTWVSLSNRLKRQITDAKEVKDKNPENPKEITEINSTPTTHQELDGFHRIPYSNNDFDGIFNYLQKQTDIDDELKITFSSYNYGVPQNLIHFDNDDFFGTGNKSNSWICFEFTKRKIIPTNYTIKSCHYGESWVHPRSWVIEGSEDSQNWDIIDEQNNCSLLNGEDLVHTFTIHNENNHEFKYIRIRQTDHNWRKNNCLYFNSIEFYGLIN